MALNPSFVEPIDAMFGVFNTPALHYPVDFDGVDARLAVPNTPNGIDLGDEHDRLERSVIGDQARDIRRREYHLPTSTVESLAIIKGHTLEVAGDRYEIANVRCIGAKTELVLSRD